MPRGIPAPSFQIIPTRNKINPTMASLPERCKRFPRRVDQLYTLIKLFHAYMRLQECSPRKVRSSLAACITHLPRRVFFRQIPYVGFFLEIIHALAEPDRLATVTLDIVRDRSDIVMRCMASKRRPVPITFSHLPPLCACQLDHGAYTEARLAV